MTVEGVLAQATVRDLGVAEPWYAALFGRPPDVRPMEGLLEWHLGEGFGVQVHAEPERAGRSTLVLAESDLDAAASRLAREGLATSGPEPATSSRILVLADPDGNRVVLAGR